MKRGLFKKGYKYDLNIYSNQAMDKSLYLANRMRRVLEMKPRLRRHKTYRKRTTWLFITFFLFKSWQVLTQT